MKSLKVAQIGLFISLIFFISTVNAQETTDYDEYSYLWENSKSYQKQKRKEEKRKQKELKKTGGQQSNATDDFSASVDSAADSLQVSSSADSLSVPADSLDLVVRDSIPNSTSGPIPVDSLKTGAPSPDSTRIDQSFQEPPFSDDSLQQETGSEQLAEESIKPKEKKEAPPIDDFRTGMQASPGGSINGGFTFTQIDGENYVGLILNPEFTIGKVGVGLNVPVLYGLDEQSIRTDIFKDGVGAARLITYLRYGVQKRDPVYVKVGQLDNISIGFGGLVNNYTNSTSLEKRKLGLHMDFNVRRLAGIEAMYSDFDPASRNLLAIRPYVRPLAFTAIPVVRTIEIGATFVSDKDQTSISQTDSTSNSYLFTREGVSAFGIDAGATIVKVPFIQLDAFFNYSTLNVGKGGLTDSLSTLMTSIPTLEDGYDEASGWSFGMNFRLNFIADLFKTDIRIERLSYQEHYLPQFFDFNYELNKDARIFATVGAEKKAGIYGSLTGHVLDKLQLGGSLLIPDDVSEESPAVVQVNATADRLLGKVSINALYLKGDLADLGDAFKLDERSIAKVRFVYHVNKFLVAGMDYYWAFTPVGDGSVKATRYVSPYIGFSIEL